MGTCWASLGGGEATLGILRLHSLLARPSVCPRARASLASVTLFAPAGDSAPPPTPASQRLVLSGSRGAAEPLRAPPPTIASRQAEIVKRLSGICAQIVPFLTQEVSGPGGAAGQLQEDRGCWILQAQALPGGLGGTGWDSGFWGGGRCSLRVRSRG